MDTDEKIKVIHLASVDMNVYFLILNLLSSLQEEGYNIQVICSDGPWVPKIIAAGIPVKTLKISRSIKPLGDLLTLWQLICYLRQAKPIIVHTHTPKANFLGQLAAKLTGVPIIVSTIHGFYFHENMRSWAQKFFIAIETIAAFCSDSILSVNSEDVMTAIREKICDETKIKALGNGGIGINLTKFNPRLFSAEDIQRKKREIGISSHAKIVGFVGRLVKEKGLLELFAAAHLIKEKVKNVKFLVVGPVDRDKKDAVTSDVLKDSPLKEDVIFLGVRTDMPALYSVMDVFVLPSYREGFPRTVMEASAMGVPVVATNVRGCREAVKHGQNGLLVHLKDVPELAKAIIELLNDEQKAKQMGEAGKRMAEQFFDERLVFQQVKDEYRRLLTRIRKKTA